MRALLLVSAVLALGGAPSAASRQDPAEPSVPGAARQDEGQADPIVERILVQGNRRYTSEQLVAALGVPVGRPLDVEEVGRGIDVLWRTFKVLADVRFRQVEGGVELLLVVEELPLDLEPRFIGNVDVDERELLEWAHLQEGEELYVFEAQRIRERLLRAYREEGYFFAEVNVVQREAGVDEETGEPIAPDVIFEIEEGPRVRVREVVLHGNDALPDRGWWIFRRGLSKLAGLELRSPRLFNFFSKAYVRETLDADLIALREVLRDRGYLDAVVELRELEFDDERRWVTIHVDVDPGPKYVIGSLAIEALEFYRDPAEPDRLLQRPLELVFPQEDLLALLDLGPGDVFERNRLRNDERTLRTYYGEQGYVDHPSMPTTDRWQFLDPELTFEPDQPVVHVTYQLAQGRQQRIREVRISGNLHTRDRIVRDLIEVEPGEIADLAAIARSRTRIQGTGYFSDPQNVIEHREPTFRFVETDDPGWKDLEYTVEEGQVLEFRVSGGISSNDGAFGILSMTQRNFDISNLPSSPGSLIGEVANREAFHGAGQELRLQAAPGTEASFFSVYFRDPDVFRLHRNRISMSLTARRGFRRYDTHDETRDSFGFRIGRQVGQDGAVFAGYSFGTVEVEDIETGGEPTLGNVLVVPGVLKQQEGSSDLSYIELGYHLQLLDQRLSPRNGVDFLLTTEIYDELVGSDFEFVKNEVAFDWFDEFDDDPDIASDRYHVGLRMGVAVPYGKSDFVPYSERFFLGGQRLMRGFDFRGIGPNENSFPAGGSTYLFGTLEYRRPLVTTTQPGTYREIETVHAGLFVDAGVLDPEDFSLDLDETRISVGFLFGLSVPIPITFSFGFPVREEDSDRTQFLQFSIFR